MDSLAKSINSVYTYLSPRKSMAHPHSAAMYVLATRLASFEITKQKGKKRTSTKSKKPTWNWPLDSPTPEDLAQAGFFLTATPESTDNVTCFCCHKSLDEWEEGDDPFQEHMQFAPECPWAVTMAVERNIIMKDEEHDPLASEYLDIRIATFGDMWPHEKKKGWTCKVKKLADAGWHYSPTPDEDDQTKCAYCSLSISCWEPKDKPVEEHKRRSPECPFFRLAELHKKSRKAKKARASKASRMSAVSSATANRELSQLYDEAADIDDSIMTTATDVSTMSAATTSTRKSTRTKKATTKATRGTKKQGLTDPAAESEEEDNISSANVAFGKDSLAGTKRSSAVFLDEDGDDEILPVSKKRTSRARSSTVRPENVPIPRDDRASGTQIAQLDHNMLSEEHLEPQIQDQSVIESNPPNLAPAKRGARTTNTRPSQSSRKPSAATTRKASGARKASARKVSAKASADQDVRPVSESITDPMIPDNVLDDSTIEAQLLADLERADSDEDMLKQTSKAAPKRQTTKKSQATASESRKTSTAKSNLKLEPVTLPLLDDDSEEDELANTYPTKAPRSIKSISAQDAASNTQGMSVEDASDDSMDDVAMPVVKKAGKKSSTVSKSKSVPAKTANKKLQKKNSAEKSTIEEGIMPSKSIELRFSSSFEETPSFVEDTKSSKSTLDALKSAAPAKASKHTVNASVGNKIAAQGQSNTTARQKTNTTRNPSGKSAARVLPGTPTKEDTASSVQPAPASTPGAFPSPTPSLLSSHGSNAENEPPSSRPSFTRPPLTELTPNKHMSDSHLRSDTPATPSRSVIRSQHDDRSVTPHWMLQSGFPWRAVDIENVFLPSPETKRFKWFAAGARNNISHKDTKRPLQASKDLKENSKAISSQDREKQEKITQMQDLLTAAEKEMTVEEWIRQNAESGEEKLRTECERVVSRFESEGIRAMKALEGLVVNEWA